MRQLEGTLADYNLAMDKHRVSTDPAELNDYINEFEAKNKQFPPPQFSVLEDAPCFIIGPAMAKSSSY